MSALDQAIGYSISLYYGLVKMGVLAVISFRSYIVFEQPISFVVFKSFKNNNFVRSKNYRS